MSNQPIANVDTPDPWILPHKNHFYLTFTLDNRVEIWRSPFLEDFRSIHTRKSVIYHPPAGSPWSANLWAPELHLLDGTFYVYFCAAPPRIGNPGHRTTVLRCRSADPMDARAWEFLGPLRNLPDDQWSIDATVFTLPSGLYCCYSGWPLGDHSDTQQDLFLVKLADPTTAIRQTLTCISRAQLAWERPDGGRRGVNEGPEFLCLTDSAGRSVFTGIVYSAHGSWGPDYKLGLLACVDLVNPCREAAWVKRPVPLLVSGDASQGGPYGPGHASFVPSPHGDGRVFVVYHGTERRDEGWANRKARVISLGSEVFRADALPVCCAVSALGARPGAGVGGNYASVRPPAEQGPGVYEGANAGSVTTGSKIWSEFERRVPGQYRGYLDKVRKFF